MLIFKAFWISKPQVELALVIMVVVVVDEDGWGRYGVKDIHTHIAGCTGKHHDCIFIVLDFWCKISWNCGRSVFM